MKVGGPSAPYSLGMQSSPYSLGYSSGGSDPFAGKPVSVKDATKSQGTLTTIADAVGSVRDIVRAVTGSGSGDGNKSPSYEQSEHPTQGASLGDQAKRVLEDIWGSLRNVATSTVQGAVGAARTSSQGAELGSRAGGVSSLLIGGGSTLLILGVLVVVLFLRKK